MRARLLQCLLLVMAVVLASGGRALADLEASLELQPVAELESGESRPRLGDPINMLVRIQGATGLTFGTPRLAMESDVFVLLPEAPPATGAGRMAAAAVEIEIPVRLVAFALGEQEFPGLVVPWADADGNRGEISTGTLTVEVRTTVADPEAAEPADIRGPLQFEVRRPLPWLLLVAAVLLMVALWIWYRRRRRPELAALAPPLDLFDGMLPADWALRELKGLDEQDVLGRQGTAAYHVRLAEIVRHYVEGQFSIETLERTSTEILASVEVKIHPLPGPRGRLRQVLSSCDLVKFARLRPDGSESTAMLELARRFIQETRPRTAAAAE